MLKKLFFISFIVISTENFSQSLTLNVNPSSQQLTDAIMGSGVTVSNFTVNCANNAIALFSGGTTDQKCL